MSDSETRVSLRSTQATAAHRYPRGDAAAAPELPAVASNRENGMPSINTTFTAETHDCREKVRPGNGREAGLGHAGGRAPKVGALGDAWSNYRKNAEKFFNEKLLRNI